MDALPLSPGTVKTLRKARKLGRTRLAKIAGLSERQITRLESAPDAPTAVVLKLADALTIPPGVLTGDIPLAEEDLIPASDLSCGSGCGCC